MLWGLRASVTRAWFLKEFESTSIWPPAVMKSPAALGKYRLTGRGVARGANDNGPSIPFAYGPGLGRADTYTA